MKVLVTGAGGFLGKGLVSALCARDYALSSLQRGDYAALEALGIEIHKGDIADKQAVLRASRACDVVFHAAAKAGVWGAYQDYYQSNVVGTKNVIAACRENGIRKLVYTSSPSIVFDGEDEDGIDESAPYAGHMLTHYQRTKAEAERLVLAANEDGLASVALRPHLVFGPGDPHLAPRIIARARKGRLRLVGRRKNRVDITYIDNAVAAHLAALDNLLGSASCAGKAYFISNGEPLPMADIVNKILAAAGLPALTKTISPGLAYGLGAIMELAYVLLRSKEEPPLTRFIARQLARAHWYDISAARRELGYQPFVSIEEGMQRLQESLADEKADDKADDRAVA